VIGKGEIASELKERRFRLDIRKTFFFHNKCGEAKNRSPREMVDAPSLEIFKIRLD